MLHAREAGRRPAVVLLHGFPLNARMWEPQLAGLGERAHLIAVDLPGFGLSPLPAQAPSLADYARAVRKLVDHLGLDKVLVVGLSMGGYVAFRLVEELGPRLVGLLLADTRANADSEAAAAMRHELAAEVESEGVIAAVNEFMPKLIGATTLRAQPAVVDRARAIMLENSVAGVAGALRAMAGRPDSTALLGSLRVPVLCVGGDEDTLTPPDVLRAMAKLIPGARVEILPGAGHLSNLEAPAAFNDALDGLMRECLRI